MEHPSSIIPGTTSNPGNDIIPGNITPGSAGIPAGKPGTIPKTNTITKNTSNPGNITHRNDIIPGNITPGNAGIPAGKPGTIPQTTSIPADKPNTIPKGWYNRQYLPHLDQPDLLQAITFRLHDAVPLSLVQDWKTELTWTAKLPASDPRVIELRKRIAHYEDAHVGACWLRQHSVARMLEATLLFFHGQRYQLHAWCIMPNHVHVLVEPREGWKLGDIVHTWKSYSAQQANRILLREGTFWFREYFNRYIRSEAHYHAAVAYIENNPVKAGLTNHAETWPYSSARLETHAHTKPEISPEPPPPGSPPLGAPPPETSSLGAPPLGAPASLPADPPPSPKPPSSLGSPSPLGAPASLPANPAPSPKPPASLPTNDSNEKAGRDADAPKNKALSL